MEWTRVDSRVSYWEDGEYSATIRLMGNSIMFARLIKSSNVVWSGHFPQSEGNVGVVERQIRRTIEVLDRSEYEFQSVLSEVTS